VSARSIKTSASRIVSLLAARYAPPTHAFFQEVGDAVGVSTRRHADAVAVGLWPSRGLDIIGFEIKVSRGDWLRELKDPEKAEAVQGYCDEWWIVAEDGIIDVAEFPKMWGLLVADGKTLKTIVKAPTLTAKPLDRHFLCAVLRRAAENTVPKCSIDDKIAEAYESGLANGLKSAGTNRDHRLQEAERAIKALKEFEEKSGIEIEKYSEGHVGEAFKAFRKLESHWGVSKWLRQLRDHADSFAATARESIKALGIEEESKP